jgi:hypothetical protein
VYPNKKPPLFHLPPFPQPPPPPPPACGDFVTEVDLCIGYLVLAGATLGYGPSVCDLVAGFGKLLVLAGWYLGLYLFWRELLKFWQELHSSSVALPHGLSSYNHVLAMVHRQIASCPVTTTVLPE